MAATYFISDLHLDASRPQISDLFVELCAELFSQGKALYILGDFVEYWLGDDQPLDDFLPAFSALEKLAEKGVEIYLMHGNRDFLIGSAFAERWGLRLLPDPSLILLDAQPILLMHGDTLCSDDIDYQKFRKMVRDPVWQNAFLAKPLSERLAIATQVRNTSRQAMSEKPVEIMDVNPHAVEQVFAAYQAKILIHGHTHRPGKHQHNGGQRFVLGDWYQHASVLIYEAGKFMVREYQAR